MIVMGIDASLSSTGFAIMNIKENDIEFLEIDKIQTKKEHYRSEDFRICAITDRLKEVIQKYNIECIVLEEQFMSKNSKTVLSLRKMLGSIMYMAIHNKVQVEYLYPSTTRKLLMDNGKARKEDVASYIQENYIDIGEYTDKTGKNKTSDMYDALALGIAYYKKEK